MATSTQTTIRNREFRFVPYGDSFEGDENDTGRPTVSCDGRIPGGVSLELTHWTDNETPNELYADTSTEMALKFAKLSSDYLPDALILNNHYDTDGVLSVWACLHPTQALEYATLLKQGAEAGDFGEWNSDEGVKLDCMVESFLTSVGEEEAYRSVLKELPSLLHDLRETGGESYRTLWEDGFQTALSDYESIQDDSISLSRGPGKMVLIKEQKYSSPYAVHRGLAESGLTKDTTRILHVVFSKDESSFRYRYEMPGYGWVKKLVDRPVIPHVADNGKLVVELGDAWTPSGGLTGICHTTQSIQTSPDEIASLLYELDDGCK